MSHQFFTGRRRAGGAGVRLTKPAAVAVLAVAGLAGSTVAASASASTTAESAVKQDGAVGADHAVAQTPSYTIPGDWFTEPDSGSVETVTVPKDVVAADVSAAGASGANLGGKTALGWGAILDGTIDVRAGDVLTVATGRQGQQPNGNKSPGVGGWSLPGAGYQGGNGGSGRGSASTD